MNLFSEDEGLLIEKRLLAALDQGLAEFGPIPMHRVIFNGKGEIVCADYLRPVTTE